MLLSALLALVAGAGLQACQEPRPPAPTPPPPSAGAPAPALYAPTSPWNTPVPGDAQADAHSATMLHTVVEAARSRSFVIAVGEWSRPLYHADAATPRHTVTLTAPWAPASTISDVPIPANAVPDPAGDGHMVIVDRATGCEYDFWQAVRGADGGWSASWANATSTAGPGWYPRGLSATGSGAAGAAGVIRPEELRDGEIRHALFFAYPDTRAGAPVLPATEGDGRSTNAGAIPEGARLQLDPGVDLSALGLNPYETIVARALQRYGMILGDTGGGVGLVAQNPLSTTVPYPWGDQTYVDLPPSLLTHMRVLALGQPHDNTASLEPTPCATLR
ncbi:MULTISPECIES: hypothetical protein [unclassified Frankia]|uniref:hypothetical protein n=1 Tax=unclassified Frankia TaxID=2632575 RepID=UPI0020253B9B